MERRQQVLSNNLANASTRGFKAEGVFAQMMGNAITSACMDIFVWNNFKMLIFRAHVCKQVGLIFIFKSLQLQTQNEPLIKLHNKTISK